MCLTIPGKIKSIKEGMAVVENGSRTAQIDLGLCLDAQVGDWVLYATDRAVKRISEEDARDIIALLEDHYHPVDVSKLPLLFKKIIIKVRSRQSIQNSKFKIQNDGGHSVVGLSKTSVQHSAASIQNLGDRDQIGLSTTPDPSSKVKGDSALGSRNSVLTKDEIIYLLNLKGKDNLETLFAEANSLRKEMIEDFVCIHGIIEFSNYCKNNCLYCGIRCGNKKLKRYRLTQEEIIDTTIEAVENEGYKLIVLQSGEDEEISDDFLLETIEKIKKKSKVFIFLSVGERSQEFYKKAKAVGASGSLMRFETSNSELYAKMRPGKKLEDRLSIIEYQKSLGYYLATGNMTGLPEQTLDDIADDLLLIQKLRVPMISSGPFIPASNTPLEKSKALNSKFETNSKIQITNQNSNIKSQTKRAAIPAQAGIQDYNDLDSNSQAAGWNDKAKQIELFLKYIAIARLMMPEIKIPVTTALETLDPENGRHKGLLAGANALMFNLTPERYFKDYNIYDNKYREREKVWQKYGLFQGEESWEMIENRLNPIF